MKFNFENSHHSRKSAYGRRDSREGLGKVVQANIGGSRGTGGTGGGGGGGFPGSGSGNNLTSGGQYDVTRYNPVHDHLEIGSLIEDWMPRDASGLHQMWRLIYLRDAIVGPSIDLYSNLPYSEYRLTGIDDPEILRVYQDTMERLDISTMMPELVKEFLTIGKFCSSLIFDSKQGSFIDWTHHDPDFLRIEPIPVRGFDPKVDLVASPALKNFIHSMDDRDLAVKEQLPEEYLRELEKQGTYKLNPLSTLFVPRRASPYDFVGCVTGDTLLSTDKGFIRISEIPNIYPSRGDGKLEAVSIQVPAIAGQDTATHWVDKGEQPTKGLITEHGYRLTGTLDHPVLTLDTRTCQSCWVPLSEISEGSIIALNKKEIWPDIDVVFESTPVQPSANNAKIHVIPQTMTQELALILGYLTSEGYVREDKISFSNSNPEVLEDFLSAFRLCFPTYEPCVGKPRENGLKEITIASVHITRFLHSLGLAPVRAHQKEIPWSVLQSTKNSMAAYLSGLFEGDGTTRADECGLTSKSEELIRQTQVVLLNFGILCSISSPLEGVWFLRMSGSQYDLFHKKIGFRSSAKTHESTRRGRRPKGFNKLPGLEAYVRKLVKDRRVSVGTYINDEGNTVKASVKTKTYGWFNTRSNVYRGISWLRSISVSEANKVQNFVDQTLHWEMVSETSDEGTQRVYDLVVPNSHAFTSNGIVSHNTSFLTRIVSFWALEKSLIESTVTNARRRTRSILHVNAGLENLWEPTEEELEAISGLFIQADEDPVGAVVTTRTGVETSEIRGGGDFWKLSDEWAFLTEGKMRALGISDAFLCLSGDTYIPTVDRGIVKIRDFLDKTRIKNFKESIPVDARNITVNSQYGLGHVDSWVYSGKKKVYKLTTDFGYDLSATKEHRFPVLRDGGVTWEPLENIQKNDHVIIPTNKCVRNTPLSLDRKIKRSCIEKIPNSKKINLPTEMTPSLAFLLGGVVSEGVIFDKHIRFTNSSQKFIKSFNDKVKEVLGIECSFYTKKAVGDLYINGIKTVSGKDCVEASIHSVKAVELFANLGAKKNTNGLGRKNSHVKNIPWSIMEADEQSQLSFLAAYLEGDGTVSTSKRTIAFYSFSDEIRKQIQVMLATHGIISVRRGKAVSVHGPFAIRLMTMLRPYLLDKNKEFKALKLHHNRFGIPSKQFIEKLEKRIVKVTNRGVHFLDDEGGDIFIKNWVASLPPEILNYEKYTEGEYTDWLNMVRKVDKTVYGTLINLFEQEYFFDTVSSVEYDREIDTYDLMMNSNYDRSFVASGILTHNSGDASYNNMETALSVFMETLRTLRTYMDRRIFYEKIFATLARVHGFTKKDAKSRGPNNLRRTMNYKKALSIPKEDLLMPKIVWDKKLQPEGDMNFMEMLRTADEAGVPVTMKQWASGAGLNLEEMMEDLSEDAQYRKKIAEWRKQFTGDQAMEQEVLSGEGLRSIPIWDEKNNFVALSSTEAIDILEHFMENRRNMLKLTSADETMRTISAMVDGHALKTELMAYLLRRLGVKTDLPIEERAVDAIGEHLLKIGKSSESSKVKKAVHAEFQTLARVMSKDIPKERKLALLEGMSNRQDMSPFTPKAVTGV